MSMFCFQCQETAGNKGCTVRGVCGKTDDVANLQDLLVYTVKGLSLLSTLGRNNGIQSAAVDSYILDALFTTITNANFHKEQIAAKIQSGLKLISDHKDKLKAKGITLPSSPAINWSASTTAQMESFATSIGVLATTNEDVRSLRELIIYGVKGIAAYGEHALRLGKTNDAIFAFMQKAMAATLDDSLDADTLTALVLETGKFGVDVMALLDNANTSAYGNPEITKVNIGVRKNPGILISGHDLKDMEMLLEQTKDSGVDVYTHSEMLPANYYPAFKKYTHFVGNYGNAWHKQKEEFTSFNGPILFTTNCIVPPAENASYKDRIYTTNSSGLSGSKHILADAKGQKDFSEIIAHAKKCASPTEIETGEIVGGFAHAQVLALADKVIDAVKSGAIKKFVVMAGCDGRFPQRQYYTDFAKALPEDTVILTAGCAKYRYNKLKLGDIGGIPRVLDAGQCNDSYSLAVTALKLKEVFSLEDINDLPIVYNIAWYEQKAIIVLLALLYLGVKNIHAGPTLPAFLSPNVAKVLIEKFNLGTISTVEEDVKNFLA